MARLRIRLLLAALLALLLPVAPTTAAAPFVNEAVLQAQLPTALAFTPDGRMFVAQQTGQLLLYSGSGAATLVLDLAKAGAGGASLVCSDTERGLLGVAVDPQFAQNGFLYLYYTARRARFCPSGTSSNPDAPVNRAVRMVLQGGRIDITSQVILVDNILSLSGRHNAGDLQIPVDGYLYISVGEGGTGGGPAQSRNSLGGKILRVDRATGAGVPGNPYYGQAGSARCGRPGGSPPRGLCEEVFALGLRNPLRMAFRPGTNEFRINDVGQGTWEEVNVGRAGANYGWPAREGYCAADSRCTAGSGPVPPDPLFTYRHGDGVLFGGCSAATGGAFVPPGVWPPEYDGVYLFADYSCGRLFSLTPTASGGVAVALFSESLGGQSVVDLEFGPDGGGGQALYYTNYVSGAIGRIRYTGGPRTPPRAQASLSPAYGPLPLLVRFDGSGSAAPDGGDLTYRWDFGDGTSAEGPLVSHSYTAAGVFSATLTVRDAQGATASSPPLAVYAGDTPAVPTITSPLASTSYGVGQVLTLRGSATDAEDGPLDGQSLVWQVLLHHDAHTHPLLAPTEGNGLTISAPAPEDLAAVTTSYIQIDLRARDRQGLLSPPTTLLVRPQVVTVTLESEPPGMLLTVNGQPVVAPAQIPSWPGYVCSIVAPSQQVGSSRLMLARWSDAPVGSRAITTTAENELYRAIFAPAWSSFVPLAGLDVR